MAGRLTFVLNALLWGCWALPGFAQPPITALAVSPDGKQVIVGSQAGLRILSLPELKLVGKLPTKLKQIHDLRFDPAGGKFAAVGGTPSENGLIEIYSWPKPQLRRRFEAHTDVIYSAEWLDARLMTASLDREVRIHGAGDTTVLAGHSRGVTALARLDKQQILSAGIDQSLRFWSLADKKPKLEMTRDHHTQPIHDVAAHTCRDGKVWIASVSSDRSVRFWFPNGRMVRFRRLSAVPLAIAWLADERVAVSCTDGQVRVLDPTDATLKQTTPTLKGWAHSIAAVPGKPQLVVGGDNGKVSLTTVGGTDSK